MIVNIFDIRLYDPTGGAINYPATTPLVGIYLAENSVQSALHVNSSPHHWAECNSAVKDQLNNATGVNSTLPQLTQLLEKNLPTLIYSGQFDLICNHVGTSLLLESVTKESWSHIEHFKSTQGYVWMNHASKRVAGYSQTYDSLIFLRVVGAGHMVPLDQPENAQLMFETFIRGGNFSDHVQDYPVGSSKTYSVPLWIFIIALIGTVLVTLATSFVISYIVLLRKVKRYEVLQQPDDL